MFLVFLKIMNIVLELFWEPLLLDRSVFMS